MASGSGIGGYCNRNWIDGLSDKPAARKERDGSQSRNARRKRNGPAPAQKSVSFLLAAAQPAPPPPPLRCCHSRRSPPAAAQPAPPPAGQQPCVHRATAGRVLDRRARSFSPENMKPGIAAMKALGYDDHPDVAGSIGFADAKLEIWPRARNWYSKALAADPNHVATLGNSGALYAAQGDLAKARADLDRIKAGVRRVGLPRRSRARKPDRGQRTVRKNPQVREIRRHAALSRDRRVSCCRPPRRRYGRVSLFGRGACARSFPCTTISQTARATKTTGERRFQKVASPDFPRTPEPAARYSILLVGQDRGISFT